jgi:hypothetical protein
VAGARVVHKEKELLMKSPCASKIFLGQDLGDLTGLHR